MDDVGGAVPDNNSTDVSLAVSYVCVVEGGGGGGRGTSMCVYLYTSLHVLSMDMYCRCY